VAVIKAFKGMRYDTEVAGDLNKLVCPPYDIISPAQREQFIEENPVNIIRLELPAGGDDRYKQAGQLLNEWLTDGVLKLDSNECVYVYEMEFTANGKRNRLKGFVPLVKLQEFSDGVVLPHEETLSKAKTDRFNLMSETMCNFSQIYSLFIDSENETSKLLEAATQNAPDMCVCEPDGTIHRMWCLSDTGIIGKLVEIFADKKLYIADGHHRYETALNFQKSLLANGKETPNSGFVAMMLVSIESDGLVIFPTHRIIKGLSGFSLDELIKKSAEFFDIKETVNEDSMNSALHKDYFNGKCTFAVYGGAGKCYIFTLKDKNAVKAILPDKSDAYCGLDVSVLHTLVLEKLLGIDKENMANQKNLTYTRDVSEALTAVDFGGADFAVILNPTKVQEILDVALANEKMPQKSTYFFPKLITGLVMNNFSE
jgi:uncharacterized protein (DUF1015 family)